MLWCGSSLYSTQSGRQHSTFKEYMVNCFLFTAKVARSTVQFPPLSQVVPSQNLILNQTSNFGPRWVCLYVYFSKNDNKRDG